MAIGIAMFGSAAAVLGYDVYMMAMARRTLAQLQPGQTAPEEREVRWRVGVALVVLAWAPILIAMSLVVVPAGMGGVRVSQLSGTLAGTLYPGAHVVRPLVDKVVLFDTRDQLFTTGGMEDHAIAAKPAAAVGAPELMKVQAKEGLTLGLAITVRYRLDSGRLDYILNNLPQPVEKELVPPVVASTWRELVPNYTVREVFASKREEVRRRAAEAITRKLEADGIVVKEVMLRDIQLPPEYAKGLEDLLLKEQQNDRMGVETEIQQKQVRIAELEAEATKAQQVKQAEGQAQVRVLQAKGEADAMKYLLPLKKQQIEQTRLESQARKEATVQGAEANAQAKVIDSKAEMERRKLLAEAEAERIRVTAAADTQRMQSEGSVLKQNPLLINKIIAEKLSDKLQIMVVPADGKFMFANDLLRGLSMGSHATPAAPDDPPNQ
ncbi:MAG TPA: SPFH domain-containing protein, partial [Terriglobales bacterium]|nr:SPFH domain-containing protein [Terriglobales bacterium]